ncbi:hypothetical protein FQA39_LY12853 [Lamprigera yunnana]|nr:hypothetical protein FQA39_LY12853 [Lamprigera yunnana]
MIAQIHDEIIFEIKSGDVDESIKIIKLEMQEALNKIYEMFDLTTSNRVGLENGEFMQNFLKYQLQDI